MQYTEEHYAEMYNNLPEGLKDLVLSGRLAILVSAIGSRHGLNADQVADLEPSIEDVCLGLITKDELVDNILKNVNVDQRVANRIAAEAELEILRPFEAELIISRKQKEDLDIKIQKQTGGYKPQIQPIIPKPVIKEEPKNVSGHSTAKVADWYSKGDESKTAAANSFDWDKDFAKKPEPVKEELATEVTQTAPEGSPVPHTLETKLDVLTESINKLVSTRFGAPEKKDEVSPQMQELLKRLERAEKENEEHKKLIKSLQSNKPVQTIFDNKLQTFTPKAQTEDANKIQIDKQRKVGIDHTEPKKEPENTGNIKITSVSKPVPIISSTVSKDTLDGIVETRNKPEPLIPENTVSTKKVLSLDELISKGDAKIKEAQAKPTTLVFPGLNDEKRIDIKNVGQKDTLRQTLLEDLEFLKTGVTKKVSTDEKLKIGEVTAATQPPTAQMFDTTTSTDQTGQDLADVAKQGTSATTTNPFKDEVLPKTKEERMKALQDKIKSLNKGVSVGGKTNITASGLDPYRL